MCVFLIRCKRTSEHEWRSDRVEKCGEFLQPLLEYCFGPVPPWSNNVMMPSAILAIEADTLHARQRGEPRHQLLLKDLRTFRVITTQFQAITHREKVLCFIPRIGAKLSWTLRTNSPAGISNTNRSILERQQVRRSVVIALSVQSRLRLPT